MTEAESYPDRVKGTLLGALCGDALGAAVEGWTPQQVARAHSNGLTTMVHHRRGRGRYTDDFQMTLALATSLVRCGHCSARDAAASYAASFDPERGYGGGAARVLSALTQGADPYQTGRMAMPDGSFGNGGAMRIAPVGLAYRHAPRAVLWNAVEAALLPTHVHPLAIDGAMVQAAAVGWLCQRRADEADCSPEGLLEYLRGMVHGLEAKGKLEALVEAVQEKPTCIRQPPITSWSAHLNSQLWRHAELATSQHVAPDFQIEATSAACAALWALICHWEAPRDAVVAAVHFGGDTDTIASMAGALAGALHGSEWVPQEWWDAVENGPGDGRDAAMEVVGKLAELECREHVDI